MFKQAAYRPRTGGRQRGTPNRVTADVRAAIALFAEENVHRLQSWLEQIAADEPAKAADLFVRLLEYHIPKLARSEVSLRGPVPLKQLSMRELHELIARDRGEPSALIAAPLEIPQRQVG
jgi:hypothetical protein